MKRIYRTGQHVVYIKLYRTVPDILTNCLLIVISCLTDVVESGDIEAPSVIVPLEC